MWDYFNKLYRGSFADFQKVLEDELLRQEKAFVITANPETLMIGQADTQFHRILCSDDTTIVADGIGVVKAAGMLDISMQGRVTGVETVQSLFGLLDRQAGSVYLFGAKKEVLDALTARIAAEYPRIRLLGCSDGYVADKDAVMEQIVAAQPDVALVALGIPLQEKLIAKYYPRFTKGIFIGVGGSFDVLSGMKKRAPAIFIKLNLEWLYRIACEPKRLKRFWQSNVKFISRIRKMRAQRQ